MKTTIAIVALSLVAACSGGAPRGPGGSADEPRVILDDISLPVKAGSPRPRVQRPAPEPNRPIAAPSGRYYTVRPKDTLFGLARRFYGDASKWRLLAQANREAIPNPDILPIGTRILVPAR